MLKYEQGRNRIAASRLVGIAKALKCDVADLYGKEISELTGVARLLRAWSKLTPRQSPFNSEARRWCSA